MGGFCTMCRLPGEPSCLPTLLHVPSPLRCRCCQWSRVSPPCCGPAWHLCVVACEQRADAFTLINAGSVVALVFCAVCPPTRAHVGKLLVQPVLEKAPESLGTVVPPATTQQLCTPVTNAGTGSGQTHGSWDPQGLGQPCKCSLEPELYRYVNITVFSQMGMGSLELLGVTR